MEHKHMSNEDALKFFEIMLAEIKEFKPDEIIGVARSGFVIGTWVAHRLKLPMGGYWHDRNRIEKLSTSKRIVFVDDNLCKGRTYKKVEDFMVKNHSNIHWKYAVHFTDIDSPITNKVIRGAAIDYYIIEPLWGNMKVSKGHGIGFRDE
jgi:hypothetical protein